MTERIELTGVQAIIILYYPDINQLSISLDSLVKQVDHIFLIDNTPIETNYESLARFRECMTYVFRGENSGVAKAQNIGISLALSNKAESVLIMDQDSVSSDNMVSNLLSDLQILERRCFKVAVIGPQAVNVQTKDVYKPRVKKWSPFFEDNLKIMRVSEIISSGSLIHKDVFDEVGLMDEKLFIDGVDHEWCWRAKVKGYDTAMSLNASLMHMLGEGDRKLMGVRVAITSPFRVFYQYRNYFYLCKKNYVPIYWKINNGVKYFVKFFYYPIFISPRALYLKNIVKGIRKGLTY